METILIIVIPLIAGIIGFFLKSLPNKVFKLILALSGAFVLAMCFMHLLPEVYNTLDKSYSKGSLIAGASILAGFLIQIALEWLTGGIEHGHSHHHNDNRKFPLGLLVGLCVHAFIEGLPLHDHGHEHSHLLVSVLVHKFPVALILVLVFKSYGLSTLRTWGYLILFTLMAPLGMWVSEIFAKGIENVANFMMIITGVVIGVLLHISTTILFEAGENHKYNATKVVMILMGFIAAYFTSM
ncbi:MAG: ZIP family metal transporter [Flavobacteriales bacterium]